MVLKRRTIETHDQTFDLDGMDGMGGMGEVGRCFGINQVDG